MVELVMKIVACKENAQLSYLRIKANIDMVGQILLTSILVGIDISHVMMPSKTH